MSDNINKEKNTPPLSCLIAEDNLVNQKILTRFLNNLGLKPDLARDGLEAVEYVQKKDYDVVLMDIQMPRMDGLKATKCILNDCKLQKSPVIIAVTANTSEEIKQMCLDIGMKGYISKPISMTILKNALQQWANYP